MSNHESVQDRLPLMFKALGNAYRLAIFQRLSRCCQPGTCCSLEEALRHSVGELGEGLEIAMIQFIDIFNASAKTAP